MDDSRLSQIAAALDDARTFAHELIDEMPSTDPLVLPLKRVIKHANDDLDALPISVQLW